MEPTYETIFITLQEFLATIAPQRAMVPAEIIGQARREYECGEDWRIFVTSKFLYVVKHADLNEYFEPKMPPPQHGLTDPKKFREFINKPVEIGAPPTYKETADEPEEAEEDEEPGVPDKNDAPNAPDEPIEEDPLVEVLMKSAKARKTPK